VDGRIVIVEYKNEKLAKAEPHKKDIGDLWEARSSGQCVFAWVVERDWSTLEAALAPE
jgi:type III restriction enzyme